MANSAESLKAVLDSYLRSNSTFSVQRIVPQFHHIHHTWTAPSLFGTTNHRRHIRPNTRVARVAFGSEQARDARPRPSTVGAPGEGCDCRPASFDRAAHLVAHGAVARRRCFRRAVLVVLVLVLIFALWLWRAGPRTRPPHSREALPAHEAARRTRLCRVAHRRGRAAERVDPAAVRSLSHAALSLAPSGIYRRAAVYRRVHD